MKFAIQPQQESPIVGSFILNVLAEISEGTLSLAEAGDVLLTFVKTCSSGDGNSDRQLRLISHIEEITPLSFRTALARIR